MHGGAAGAFASVVVVPTYNHLSRLVQVLNDLDALGLPIIVVDDGSTDATWETIVEWQDGHPGASVTPIRHDRNRGKAAALDSGFAFARELAGVTHVVTIDSDGQLDAADVPRLLDAARRSPAALVLGSRPQVIEGCPPRCMIGRRYASLGILAQTGRRLSDTQCGLRVYPLALLASVRCAARRYAFEAEVITRAVWAGFDVVEIPVGCRYHAPGERVSHFRPISDSLHQVVVHFWLVLLALVPWSRPRHRDRLSPRGGRPVGELLRDFAQWLNPLKCLRDVRSSGLGPLEFAAAMGIGAWIGTLPFFGMHTALCMYVSWRLNLKPAAMILGSQVSIPPLGIGLVMLSTAVGHFMLTGEIVSLSSASAEWSSLPRLVWHWFPAWLVGSFVVGLVLCWVVFGLTLVLTSPLRRREPVTLSVRSGRCQIPD